MASLRVRKGYEDGDLPQMSRITDADQIALLFSGYILRKEVIQPQVPLRLPCYDFTPVADLTVVGCLPYGSANRLRVKPTPMV